MEFTEHIGWLIGDCMKCNQSLNDHQKCLGGLWKCKTGEIVAVLCDFHRKPIPVKQWIYAAIMIELLQHIFCCQLRMGLSNIKDMENSEIQKHEKLQSIIKSEGNCIRLTSGFIICLSLLLFRHWLTCFASFDLINWYLGG